MTTPVTVRHNADERRFVLFDDEKSSEIGQEAYVDVTVNDETHRVMHHTEVSDDYSGQGLASQLVEVAVTDSITDGFKIVPVCPYVSRWFERRPELAEHVVKPRPEHLSAINR